VTPRALGGSIAFAIFVADQAAKAAVLSRLGQSVQESTHLAPFIDLTLRRNRGISFSLFVQGTQLGRAALLALTVAAILLLSWWLWRSRSNLATAGLGAIVGGALGNAFDRIVHGAVVDFLDLHAFGRHFFVFNVADAAINLGVVLLMIDFLFVSRLTNNPNKTATTPGAR